MRRAKARYRAVENTTTMGCNARKTNKQMYNGQVLRTISKDTCNPLSATVTGKCSDSMKMFMEDVV
jgi:hypothetical protein